MHQGIVMYGADWCGDCRRSKAFLQSRHIPFTYIDVESQPEMMEEVISLNGGTRSIPVIVFADGSHLTEPTVQQLADKVGASA